MSRFFHGVSGLFVNERLILFQTVYQMFGKDRATLFQAVRCNDLNAVIALVTNDSTIVNDTNKDGWTWL